MRSGGGITDPPVQNAYKAVGVSCLAFPNYDHVPSKGFQFSSRADVPVEVFLKLIFPERNIGLRFVSILAAAMTMPEATMNKELPCALPGIQDPGCRADPCDGDETAAPGDARFSLPGVPAGCCARESSTSSLSAVQVLPRPSPEPPSKAVTCRGACLKGLSSLPRRPATKG